MGSEGGERMPWQDITFSGGGTTAGHTLKGHSAVRHRAAVCFGATPTLAGSAGLAPLAIRATPPPTPALHTPTLEWRCCCQPPAATQRDLWKQPNAVALLWKLSQTRK